MIEIVPIERCPMWLSYPQQYLDLIKNEKDEFLPWYLVEMRHIILRREHLIRLYKRDLFPFARKDCSDDIACWEKGQGDKVLIIHDYASSGWEQREIFDNFKAWYEWALEQIEEY